MAQDRIPGSAPPEVCAVLRSGRGRPLDGEVRSFMEARFGQHLRGVRVHTGTPAAAAARAVGARAFTVGDDIVFGAGEYAPGTEAGKRLLAHELAHALQQRRGAPAAGPP